MLNNPKKDETIQGDLPTKNIETRVKLRFVEHPNWMTFFFVVAVIAGSVVIIFNPLDLWNPNAKHDFFYLYGRAIGGALVILIYWFFLITFVSRELLVRRYVCDTTYFLGFIFTLLSLVCCFIGLSDEIDGISVDDAEVKFRFMIKFAGAALITTMVAIVLRVIHRHIFNENGPIIGETIEQRLDDVSIAFKQSSSRVSDAIDIMELNFNRLARAQEKVSVSFDDAAEKLQIVNQTTIQKQKDSWEQHTAALSAATKSFVVELNDVNSMSKEFRGRTVKLLLPAMDGLIDKLGMFDQHLGDFQSVSDLTMRIDTLIANVENLVLELKQSKET